MKFTAADRLHYFIEEYGLALGVEAFYASEGRTVKASTQASLFTAPCVKEDGSSTFYAVTSTPITAAS